MLGYVLVRQPTVILRRNSECFDTCQCFFIYDCNDCNACNACNFYADVLFLI